MDNISYVGYRKKEAQIGFVITAAIAAASAIISAAPALTTWVTGWWSRPAGQTRDFLSAFIPTLMNKNPNDRLAFILAAIPKLPTKARDVYAKELLLWYKQTYPQDYMSLSYENKIYWNNYLNNLIATNDDGNDFYLNTRKAMFTPDELNYSLSSTNSITDLFSTPTSTTSTTKTAGISPFILFGLLGAGLFLISKKSK